MIDRLGQTLFHQAAIHTVDAGEINKEWSVFPAGDFNTVIQVQ